MTKKNHIRIACILLALVSGSRELNAQTMPLPTLGKEFWCGFMQNAYGAQELRLNIAAQNATSGTVSMPLTGWSLPINVPANSVITVIVPISAEHTGSEVIGDKGVLVQTSDSVTVTAVSMQSFTTDAAQVLPIQSLATTYRAEAYRGLPGFNDFYKSELLIVATADGTIIDITPSVNTVGGHVAGSTFTVMLNAGQTYQVQSQLASLDVTGTSVVGTAQSGVCRPFAVFAGSMCANVPVGCPACDHVFEEMVPVGMWGMRFHTIPLNGTTVSAYRVLADQNNTQVSVDGGPATTLNAGQSFEVDGAAQPVCITADKPISAVQIMEGYNCASAGDPSLIDLLPDERMSKRALFSTVTSAQITTHAISVITPTPNIAQMQLDGIGMNSALFAPYAGCAGMSCAKTTVTSGTHTLSSTTGFIAYAYGTGTGESYAYGVSSVSLPNNQNDSLICSSGPLTLTSPINLVNAIWTAASAPGTTLATGNSYSFTPTQNDTYSVDGELPVSACPEHFQWEVGVPVAPSLSLTANGLPNADVCQYTGVQLNATPAPDPNWFDLYWTPAGQLSDTTIANPVAYPTVDTWYRLDVVSPIGCGSVSDSVFVNVNASEVYATHASTNDSAICVGGSMQLSSKTERVIASDAFDGAVGPMWSSVQGATTSGVCGSISGTALYFNGGGTRAVTTAPMNVSTGGALHFALKIAASSAPCDDAEPGENVLLEYNVGGTWFTLMTFNEANYPAFTIIDVPLPPAACTSNTLFRWSQPNFSAAGQDNWCLDEVLITHYDNTGLNFAWTPSNSVSNPNNANTNATPTSTTWYKVTTQNNNGCAYSDSVLVIVAPAFAITASNDTTICSAIPVQLHATPNSGTGIVYSWTPNDGSLTNVNIANPVATPANTTTYSVSATTNIGCTHNENVTITVGHLTNIVVSANDQQLCQGETSQLNAVVTCGSPYAIVWTPNNGNLNNTTINNPIATPTTPTNYTATATETSSGCSLAGSVNINVNMPYSVHATPSDTICSTLGFQLNVQHNVPGPFTIAWTNPQFLNSASIASPTILQDTTATYVVTVTDANGCTGHDSTTIVSAFDNLLTPINLSSCAGQSLVLDAGYPGSTYDWTTNETTQTITVNTSAQYVAQITDAGGCVTWKNFFVTFNATPTVDLGPDVSLCGVPSYVLDANSPGNSVIWNTSETTQQITVTSTATYSVVVTSPQNCESSDAVQVTFNTAPQDVLQDVTACISTPPTLDAGNTGSTYLWSTTATTQSITPGQSGTFTVTITTPQNCTATFNANVVLMPTINVHVGNDTTVCAGQQITLDVGTPGLTYMWNTGATSQAITATSTGMYSVVASNGSCQGSDEVDLVFLPSPTDVLVDHTSCIDQPVTLNAGNSGCTFLWNTSETTQQITPAQSGTYSVIVTNSANCSVTFDASVTYVNYPIVDLGPDTSLCAGDVLDLDAGNAGSTFNWSNGAHTQIVPVMNNGTYSVSVDNGYCVSSDSIHATFRPRPSHMDMHDYFTCLDQDPHYVVIDAGNGAGNGGSFDWSNGETHQVILAGAYGWYFVNITNQFNCTTRDSANVHEFCPASIYVPNTFTPNGDGVNDVWLPVGNNIGSYDLNLFDRWGNVIFHSESPSFGWDGTINGEPAPNDVYVWRMEYKFIEKVDGTEGFLQKQMGHVTVMR